MEDVHRAGGVMVILGELDRAGLLHNDTRTVFGLSMKEQLAQYDIMQTDDADVLQFFRAVLQAYVPPAFTRLPLGSTRR